MTKNTPADQASTKQQQDSLPLDSSKKKVKALLALAVISFLWGTTWIASRIGVTYMPPLELSAIRQLLAGSIFLIYFLFGNLPWPRRKEWMIIVVLSLLNLFLTNGLTTLGVKYIPAGLASIIAAIFPLWLVVLGIPNRAKIPLMALVGLLLGFGGICVIFYEHLKDWLNADFRFGIGISLMASLTWALGTIFTKKQVRSFNPYFSICLQMIISGTLLLLVAVFSGNWIPVNHVPMKSWIAIGYLVIFGSMLSFIAYLYALQRLPAEQVSIYAYLNPVVAVILGWIFFKERFTLFMGIGGIITLYGVFLVNKSFQKIK